MFKAFSRGPFFTAVRLRFPVVEERDVFDDDFRLEDDELDELEVDEWRLWSDLCFFFLCFLCFFFLLFFSFFTAAGTGAEDGTPFADVGADGVPLALLLTMAERGMSSSDDESMYFGAGRFDMFCRVLSLRILI